MNALRDQAKSKVIEPGLPVLDKLRLAPDVFDVLKGEMNDRETWAEFAIEGMLLLASMRRMVRFDYTGTNRLLVRVVGATPYEAAAANARTNGTSGHPTDVGVPYERRKALAKAALRA